MGERSYRSTNASNHRDHSAAEPQTPDVRVNHKHEISALPTTTESVRLSEISHASKILNVSRTEITERIPGRSVRGIHSDLRPFDPPGQLADVDLILLGRVSLLRILLSVISVLSVVIRPSCLPESSPRLCAPARLCGRGRLAQFSLPQRFAVWWVALPWPILPVPAVLLALCRVVV